MRKAETVFQSRSLKKSLFVFALVIVLGICTGRAFSQTYEIGSESELKGLKKVHLDTGADVDNYNRIKENIEKAGIRLEYVSAEEAEFFILFRSDMKEHVTGAVIAGSVIGVGRDRFSTGKGMVGRVSDGGKKIRVFINFASEKNWWAEKKPATKLAKKFIAAYKKANNLD